MKYWLITGGAGFIGSHFVDHVLAENPNQPLLILDALSYSGDKLRLAAHLSRETVKFIQADIVDAEAVTAVFQKYEIEHVVHFAAETHVDRSIYTPDHFLKTNYLGTFQLLHAAREAWQNAWDNHRFLYISTDEVYGQVADHTRRFSEQTRLNPRNPYSASKAAGQLLATAWYETYGLPVLIANPTNNYGIWQFPEKLIPLMIWQALRNEPLPIYGDGRQIRDWLHVRDNCAALLLILQKGRVGTAYNISPGQERENIYVADLICQCLDEIMGTTSGTYSNLIRFVPDRPGHDKHYALDSRKIHTELNWCPKYLFEDSLKDVVRWFVENREWMNAVANRTQLRFVHAKN